VIIFFPFSFISSSFFLFYSFLFLLSTEAFHRPNHGHQQHGSDEMRQIGTEVRQQPCQLSHTAPLAAGNIAPILKEHG